MSVRKRIYLALVTMALVFSLSACVEEDKSGQQSEQQTNQQNYDRLAKAQPAESMDYSSTRETINFFGRTWGVEGKVAYVYLMNNEGTVIGYYVTAGPPVSMCTSLRPNYLWEDIPGDEDDVKQQVPAPGTDGAYYSGGECNTYYAKDANTGAYIQYTAGQGINPLLYDQPLDPRIVKDAPNLAEGLD
jgi:hypothetical protein